MLEWILIGAVLQTGMVLVGHWVTPVANLFAPFGGLLGARFGETTAPARAVE